MAFSVYTGPPGAGKSYAMVEQVIIPAVQEGRRVVANIDGVKPDAIVAHCIINGADPDKVGSVVLFHGEDAQKPGFFPTEDSERTEPGSRFVQPGDCVVIDEWAMYFSNTGPLESADLEPFLRWHRHLTGPDGQSTDVIAGTQAIDDIHRRVRKLVVRSFLFRKLDNVGAKGVFAWSVYEGHTQRAGRYQSAGHGRYKPEIYALYSSYKAAEDAKGKETRTDKRVMAWTKTFAIGGAFALLCGGGGLWYAVKFFSGDEEIVEASPSVARAAAPAQAPPSVAPRSPYRIAGAVHGDDGLRVAIVSESGVIRYLPPDGFSFTSDGRPVAGYVDGLRVQVEDRFKVASEPEGLWGI